jgi:hypothetical protein
MELDYSSIKRKIESETCRQHGLRAKFEMANSGFSINACCEIFANKLTVKAEKLIAEENETIVDKMLRNAFE